MGMFLVATIFDFVVCLCTPWAAVLLCHAAPILGGAILFRWSRSLVVSLAIFVRAWRAEGRKRGGGLSFPIRRRRLQVASTPDGKLVIILVNIII